MKKFIKDDVRFGTKPYKFDNSVKKTKLTEEQLDRLRAGESLDDILNDDQEWITEKQERGEINIWKNKFFTNKKTEENKKQKEEKKVEQKIERVNEELTKEKYIELKKKGTIDKDIMKMYGLNVMSLNKFKKEHDLVGKFVVKSTGEVVVNNVQPKKEKNAKEKENNEKEDTQNKQNESKCCGNTCTNCKSEEDVVNHPKHYTAGKIECIDALESATADLKGIEAICTANAMKYLWRWKQKNGIEDLKKARWYLDRLIEKAN